MKSSFKPDFPMACMTRCSTIELSCGTREERRQQPLISGQIIGMQLKPSSVREEQSWELATVRQTGTKLGASLRSKKVKKNLKKEPSRDHPFPSFYPSTLLIWNMTLINIYHANLSASVVLFYCKRREFF